MNSHTVHSCPKKKEDMHGTPVNSRHCIAGSEQHLACTRQYWSGKASLYRRQFLMSIALACRFLSLHSFIHFWMNFPPLAVFLHLFILLASSSTAWMFLFFSLWFFSHHHPLQFFCGLLLTYYSTCNLYMFSNFRRLYIWRKYFTTN